MDIYYVLWQKKVIFLFQKYLNVNLTIIKRVEENLLSGADGKYGDHDKIDI